MVELVTILTQNVFNPILLSLSLFYVHYIYIPMHSGCGKKEAHVIWSTW